LGAKLFFSTSLFKIFLHFLATTLVLIVLCLFTRETKCITECAGL